MPSLVAPATLLVAIVTVLAVLVYLWTGFKVGQMRGKHDIKAPAMTGNFEFECANRVQMNTLEQLAVFLPLLWLSWMYFSPFPLVVGALGLVWVVGRIVYALGYMADPSKRSTGFLIGFVATVALLITTIWGIASAWIAAAA